MRVGAAWVVKRSRLVTINQEGLERLGEELLPLPAPVWVSRYHFRGDEELTLRYLLLLDALNFCFWPPRGFPNPPKLACGEKQGERWAIQGPEGERLTGYYALSYSLRLAAENCPEFFSAERLARVTAEDMREILGQIPLISWRVAAAREVGFLLAQFASATDFFAQARGSAQRIVELLTAHLPLFRDAALYDSRWIPFYKRAQILVADLWGTFDGEGLGAIEDLGWLTAFADYKLPQVLWSAGAIKLHPILAERIKKGALIRRGSQEEVEIRAATVVAVEMIARQLRKKGREFWPFQVDWLLWELSQKGLPVPHHRTLTWAY
ncbi:MAG: queuosine salvage family protein [Candidatus Bipolaricaulota bacterium]|nr:queuosine salvage family protein [Candidatus Bipolaricaulota bacterium]MDW8127050.1 queuosine salvage family protein [Candidatus Bipolaricaulota bacterium]